MAAKKAWFVLCFSLIARAAMCAPEVEHAKEVTFSKDVAPILYSNCVTCHHADDIAPMPLISYIEARPWAAAIREAVVRRTMPPWHANPHVGDFMNIPAYPMPRSQPLWRG